MTKFDYPIENIRFNFNLVGGGFLACSWNGKMLTPNPEYNISADQIEEENTLSVAFAKFDPADEDSYATLQYFMINGGSFKSSVEKQQYKVDTHLHPDAPEEIQFDGYFGYVGRLEIKINQCNDLLLEGYKIPVLYNLIGASHSFKNEQNINEMGAVYRKLPYTWILMIIGTLALTGFPFLSGFYSKDAIIEFAYLKGNTTGTPNVALGSNALCANTTGTNITSLLNNAYLNSSASAWVYKQADEASYLAMMDGKFRFFTAAAGSAGGSITWGDEKMQLSAGGYLGIGTGNTTPRYNLQVKGNSTTAVGIALDNVSGSSTLDIAALGCHRSHRLADGARARRVRRHQPEARRAHVPRERSRAPCGTRRWGWYPRRR